MKKVISLFMLLLILASCSNGKKKDKNNNNLLLFEVGVASGGSSSSSKAPNQKPSIPTNLVASQTSTSITLKWNKSTDKDGTIADYEVSKDNGKTWESAGIDLTHTFTGLMIGITYQLQVKAKDNENAYSDIANTSFLLSKVKKVTLGYYHSFIETTDNKLFVFGDNSRRQLGLGDTTERNTPTELTNSNIAGKVKKATLGYHHSFIETTDNKLFVFGYNGIGQLGLGDTTDRNTPTELTDTRIAGKVKKVTLGEWRSFVETTDNKLFVFGYNKNGILGLGDTTDRNTPTELTDTRIAGKVKKITLGGWRSFVETTDNKLFVFGDNSNGALGLGDRINRYTPTELTNSNIAGKVKKVTLSAWNSFIETTDNKLFVFGLNKNGVLGLGDTSNRNTPTELTDTRIAGKVKKVTLGYYHSFIETTDNKLFVFGNNSYGQLGLGDTTQRNTPTELTDTRIAGKVKQVTLSGYYSFVETTDNKLFVFGNNSYGQLGLGDTSNRNTPTELTNSNIAGKVKQVTLGGLRSFVETTDNKLFVFGDNGTGQLGLGDSGSGTNRTSPTELVLP